MTPADLEAVIWRTFPQATPHQVDTILAAADAYRHWRQPPDGAGYPKADPRAAEHRAELAAALEWDGQPPYGERREAILEGGAA